MDIEKIQGSDSILPKNILVIGDAMLDIYYEGDVRRISPEAPVPVFRKRNERSVPGGASNVAANLVAAQQHTSYAAIIGQDEYGEVLKKLLRERGIDTSMMVYGKRETTVKTRFMAGNNQQVLRLDVEDTSPISEAEADVLIEKIEEQIYRFDLIVFSDYLKGLLTEYFMQGVINLANLHHIKVLADVKDSHYQKYAGAFLLKPNRKELHDLTGMPVDMDEEVFKASEYLREQCGCAYVLTTCGSRGMLLKGQGQDSSFAVEAVGREVFDVTGAGDTTIAYLAACLSNGFDIRKAVRISNYAAGLQVAKVGTSSVYLSEVRDSLEAGKRNVVHKLIDRSEAAGIRERNKGKKIVFTNGCFDILHAGHVRYLQEAAEFGDILVLGLNSDESIRRLKGLERPINAQKDRAEVLSALECIDYIVIFDEDTPYELIGQLQPDVLVKGGDYKPDEVIGKDIVEGRGGRLEILPYVDGKSTTGIIEKIKR